MNFKQNLSKIKKILPIFALFFSGSLLGFFFGSRGYKIEFTEKVIPRISRELPLDKKYLDFDLFWSVWDEIKTSYYDKSKIDDVNLIYGAIKGMVEGVGDPYTVFLPPTEQKRSIEDLSGSFDGIGIQIGFKGNQLAVIAPLPATPAAKAGVLAGDFIVGIKDEEREINRGTIGITLPEAVSAIRGAAGTKVTLILTRENVDAPFEKEITRGKITVESVTLEFIKGEGESREVALLKLIQFGSQTDSEWARAILQISKRLNETQGVVLDMRNNPGGFLQGAVSIASEFLESGVVVIQESSGGPKEEMRVSRRARLGKVPLVVIINKGSASASEIVAGALKDNKRAKIVGEVSFGKGTIQEAQEFPGGSGIHITTARWLTPSGVWVNEKGLEPDVKIEDDKETEEDEQLALAIQELLK